MAGGGRKRAMYGDQFNTQYGQFGNPMFNMNQSGNVGGNPAAMSGVSSSIVKKAQSGNKKGSKVGANQFNKAGLATIYNKKHDEIDFGFGSKSVRIAFMRKIYILLSIQLSACFGLTYFASISDDIKNVAKNNYWMLWMTMALSILILIILACCEFHKKYPMNHISFWTFTVSAILFLMVVTAIYSTQIIFLALIIVVSTNLLVAICLMQNKIEFTIYTGLFVCALGFGISFGLLMLLWNNTWNNILYAGIGGASFLVFFMVDTQMIMGGSNKNNIMEDDYVFAAMTLYTDIINLFIYILQLLNSAKD